MKKQVNYKIDKTDEKILTLLLDNARMPFLKIAKRCNLSGAAIHQRVKSLENRGVIQGYYTKLDTAILGLDITAFVSIRFEKKKDYKNVIEELSKIPEIVEAHFSTGEYDLIIKVVCKNKEDLRKLIIETLNTKIESIESTCTYISLGQIFNRPITIGESKD